MRQDGLGGPSKVPKSMCLRDEELLRESMGVDLINDVTQHFLTNRGREGRKELSPLIWDHDHRR